MKRSLRILPLVLAAASTCGHLRAQPPAGSQLPLEQNMCALCHGESDLWSGAQRRLHVAAELLAEDVHWTKGVVCHDCHGGDPASEQFANTHRKEDGFRATADEIMEACGNCHRAQMIDVTRKGVHAKAGARNEIGEGTPLDCSGCHGTVKHQLLPSQDPRSPVFLENQFETCGRCHQKELETHKNSVHGRAMLQAGLVATASCADCHGTHGIYREADKRSLLHASNVSTTCGKCHRGIDATLQNSVHATGGDAGRSLASDPPRREPGLKPTCTACHQRHEAPRPEKPDFLVQRQLPNGCGNCHALLASRHAERLHGELTDFGYVAGAACFECHGAHDIRPLHDPSSRLAGSNRLSTCQQCHPRAVQNFSDFDPHANHKDAQNYPGLHRAYAMAEALIFTAVIFFALHTVLWLLRSLVHVLRFGRHKGVKAEQHAIVRFSPMYRIFYSVVIVSLMGLALTGLAVKYSDQTWARSVARAVGGFRSISAVHRLFGVVTIACCVAYVANVVSVVNRVRIAAKIRKKSVPWLAISFGPDSPAPNWQDVKDLFGMVRWFFGLGPKPDFERWTYWEKFDYWAIVAIVAFIGSSGLILWLPNLFSRLLPGSYLNMAKVIHSEIGLLATGFLLAVRYFNTHFRPEKFPMDLSVLTGMVSEEHMRRARFKYLQRLQQEGKLESLRTTFPSKKRLWAITMGGCLVQLTGFILLAGILLAALGG